MGSKKDFGRLPRNQNLGKCPNTLNGARTYGKALGMHSRNEIARHNRRSKEAKRKLKDLKRAQAARKAAEQKAAREADARARRARVAAARARRARIADAKNEQKAAR